ncbi:MAG TPA: hypothetical protein VHG29_05385 [Novosphingobium sp.]|nr:hypothetical protein [Novosphingobium sp.]
MIEPSEPLPPTLTNPSDRWNKPKMAGFLRELAATHCVGSAAKAVGMSRQSAYKLRARLKGEPFDIAWEAAFQHGYDALHQAALERALHGVEVPVFFNGEQIGTRRQFDERLTCFLLSARNRSGAQQLSRYRAAVDFWAERWDGLIAHVEGEDERWPREWSEDANGEATRASDRYTAPDPLPRGRGV